MESLFPDNIWAFYNPEEEDIGSIDFSIKWIMPKDESKMFWEITSPDIEDYKVYASKLEFQVPSSADHNQLYCQGAVIINEDNVAIFYDPSQFGQIPDVIQEEE